MNSVEHIPVLAKTLTEQIKLPADAVAVDATIGEGGHSLLFGKTLGPEGIIVGMDVDKNSIKKAESTLKGLVCKVILIQSNFSEIDEQVKKQNIDKVDFILADLGVCSAQWSDVGMGLSFQTNMPLDMRMDERLKTTAADIVNKADEKTLADLIYRFGQDKASRRIAKSIVHHRQSQPITTTWQLAAIICKATGQVGQWRKSSIHPATRTFQALRIAVNNELENLEKMLNCAPALLGKNGYIAVLSFHSLEDRIVKMNFKKNEQEHIYKIATKKPIVPSVQEINDNPRAEKCKIENCTKTIKKHKGKGVSIMTSDAKVGLLLGLLFIFIIAFIINGLPSFHRNTDSNSNKLTTSMISATQGSSPGIGAKAREAINQAQQPPAEEQLANQPQQQEQTPPSVTQVNATSSAKIQNPPAENLENTAVAIAPPSPTETAVQADTTTSKVEITKPAASKIYVVNKGDSLASIAKKFYGTRKKAEMIFKANHKLLKSPDGIYEGQKLVIPLPAESSQNKGKIASASEATVNNTEPAAVKQSAEILSSAKTTTAKPTNLYVIREGDSLWRIASEKLGNGSLYKEIIKLNSNIIQNEDDLKVGMNLKLPAR